MRRASTSRGSPGHGHPSGQGRRQGPTGSARARGLGQGRGPTKVSLRATGSRTGETRPAVGSAAVHPAAVRPATDGWRHISLPRAIPGRPPPPGDRASARRRSGGGRRRLLCQPVRGRPRRRFLHPRCPHRHSRRLVRRRPQPLHPPHQTPSPPTADDTGVLPPIEDSPADTEQTPHLTFRSHGPTAGIPLRPDASRARPADRRHPGLVPQRAGGTTPVALRRTASCRRDRRRNPRLVPRRGRPTAPTLIPVRPSGHTCRRRRQTTTPRRGPLTKRTCNPNSHPARRSRQLQLPARQTTTLKRGPPTRKTCQPQEPSRFAVRADTCWQRGGRRHQAW